MERKTPTVSPFEQTALGPEDRKLVLEQTQALPEQSAGKVVSGSAGPASAADLSFLRPFGPFTRVEPLSEQGAMGLVARGYNSAFDRWELLKFLRSEHAQNPELLRQFQREGRVLAKLSHPNVVQIFAIYALDGRPCLSMEFLEGESLQAHAARQGGQLPVARWYELFLSAARGLAAAHEVGLLHRDLKPENLFVVEERKGVVGGLKLIDFGLATADRSRRDVAHDPSLIAVMSGGTPLFMAPELWRQQEASPRSDLFALGMTFFVAAAGRLPYTVGTTVAEVAMAVCHAQPFPEIRDIRTDMPAPLSAVLRRLLAKQPEERFENAVELVAALVAASAEARTRRVPGSGPYRGLSSFSSSERDVFFGRETEVVEVLERLRAQGGLVLVGPSGSGKSSLAHAGVVPAIEEGALGGGMVFRTARFEPRSRPLASLAAALSRVLSSTEEEMLAFLRTSPEELGQRLRARLPPGTGLLLLVDQLEEMATLAGDSTEVSMFSRALGSITEVLVPELRVLATLRADLMDRLFSQEALRPLLTRGFYPVRPLLGDGLRQALVGPAKAAGYSFEDPALVDAILSDVARSSAGLPLMSFAMSSWWQARDEARKVLPTAAWKSLGGLAGALARHGDSVLTSMGTEQHKAAEQILLRLVSADGTRARAPRSALLDPAATGPGAERALERMLQSKLLHESSGEIELAHESLISQWPTLRQLLLSSGEDRAFRERVAAAAREWDAQGRPAGALWTDEQALRLLRWFEVTPSTLDQNELAFMEAVRARLSRKKFLVRAGVFAALAVALTFALITKRSEHELRERLLDTTKRASQLELDYRKAEGARLRALAERQLEEDPSRALTTSFESYEKSPSPALDILSWRARFRGLPYPLPLHRKGARFAIFSRNNDWIATGGGDGAVFVQSASNSDTALVRPSRDDHALPQAVAFSRDTLAVGSSIGELVLAQAPKFSPTVVDHCANASAIERIGWLGDSVLALCGGQDAHLIRYAPSTKQKDELAHGGLVDLALSQDGNIGLAAFREGKLLLIDAKGATELASPAKQIARIAVSPYGDRLLVAEQDGTVHGAPFSEGKAGKFTTFPEKVAGPPLALGAGPQGASFVIGANHHARLWLESRSFTFETGATSFTWSPAQKLLFFASQDDEITLVSLLTGEPVGRLQGSSGEISSVHVNNAGTWAVVSSADGATRGYRLEDCHTLVTRGATASPPSACAVAPDGSAAGCAEGRTLRIFPVQGSVGGLKAPREQALDAEPNLIALGPRGEYTSWALPDRWGVQERTLPGLATPTALRVSERHAALAGKQADKTGMLLLASLRDGAPRTLKLGEPPLALAFAQGGHRLAVVTASNVHLVDPESASLLRSIPLAAAQFEGDPSALAFSDDSAMLAIGSRMGVVALVPIEGKSPRRIKKFATQITCLSWAQAGRALAVSTADHRKFALDTDTGQNFLTGYGSAAASDCARSPIDDRFTYVLANGSTLLRLIDAAPLTMSKAPEPTLDPRTMPLQQWPGLPKVWR